MMLAPSRNGSVVTFYSYKGGVGRSFLVANVAALLGRWGYRVLCIDWDIEAPGLDDYFRPWLRDEAPGLVDLVDDFAHERARDWRGYVTPLSLPGVQGELSVMTAGRPDDGYMTLVQTIDWRSLYDKKDFGAFLEGMREEWKREYDFVLIDSRTGITDIGGICTVHLPDLLVLLFTANHQSFDGAVKIAGKAAEQRARLPLNRAGLLTLPVPSRIDSRGQDSISNEWMRRFAERLAPLYEPWLDAEMTPRQILELTRVPYFSVWTFGERLAVLEERENDPERISYHFATIAALVARRLGDSDHLLRSRDLYVDGARNARPATDDKSGAYRYDFFLSYSRDMAVTARDLAALLKAAGQRVFGDDDQIGQGSSIQSTLEAALAASRRLVMLVGEKPSQWQLAELVTFVEARGDDHDRTLEIIHFGSQPSAAMRSILSGRDRIREINATMRTVEELAAQLVPRAAAAPAAVDDRLRALADGYASMPNPRRTQVLAEAQLTGQLGQYVLENRVSRDELADSGHEGLVVALADAILRAPEQGDLARLLRAGAGVRRVDAAARVVMALGTVSEQTHLSRDELRLLEELLVHYDALAEEQGDRPLKSLVETARRRRLVLS